MIAFSLRAMDARSGRSIAMQRMTVGGQEAQNKSEYSSLNAGVAHRRGTGQAAWGAVYLAHQLHVQGSTFGGRFDVALLVLY